MFSLAILARLVFEGNKTEEAKRGLSVLAEPVVRQPLTWAAGGTFGGPADWARLNFALEAVYDEDAAIWQGDARRLVRQRQITADDAETLRGSWDPTQLGGRALGPIRLTACCLGVLYYRCYAMLRVAGPR